MTIIDQNWNPSEKTRESIKKRFITFDQYRPVLMQFRRENNNKEVKNASSVFLKMFDKTHGKDVPKPDRTKDIENEKKRQFDIDNKSPNSKEKASEIKRPLVAL